MGHREKAKVNKLAYPRLVKESVGLEALFVLVPVETVESKGRGAILR